MKCQLHEVPAFEIAYKSNATFYQIEHMAKRTGVDFTVAEKRLYAHLREGTWSQPVESVVPGSSRPGSLTDERLMIHICLMIGDVATAELLLSRFPSIQL